MTSSRPPHGHPQDPTQIPPRVPPWSPRTPVTTHHPCTNLDVRKVLFSISGFGASRISPGSFQDSSPGASKILSGILQDHTKTPPGPSPRTTPNFDLEHSGFASRCGARRTLLEPTRPPEPKAASYLIHHTPSSAPPLLLQELGATTPLFLTPPSVDHKRGLIFWGGGAGGAEGRWWRKDPGSSPAGPFFD